MAAGVALFSFYFLGIVIGVEGWRCAKYQHYFSQQPDYIECVWDCCGNSFNRHCCAPIGIIVGCSIVGAVVVAALVVLLACWWQRRRARYNKGPRLFHNRKHSHYPVAPTSVTRPAPLMPYRAGTDGEGQVYRPPPSAYRPRPSAPGYDPEKKVPPTDFYGPDDRPSGPPQGYRPGPPPGQGYRQGPPPGQGYRPGPPPGQGYRPGPPPDDEFRSRPPPGQGPRTGPPSDDGYRPRPPPDDDYRRGPPPPGHPQRQGPPQQRPPVREYFD